MNRSYLVTALRRFVNTRRAAELTDSHLLECYVASREEAAFAALVRRHGGMVWGGSRIWAGARAQAVLMSVWRTCWQEGRPALDFLSQRLRGMPVALALPP